MTFELSQYVTAVQFSKIVSQLRTDSDSNRAVWRQQSYDTCKQWFVKLLLDGTVGCSTNGWNDDGYNKNNNDCGGTIQTHGETDRANKWERCSRCAYNQLCGAIHFFRCHSLHISRCLQPTRIDDPCVSISKRVSTCDTTSSHCEKLAESVVWLSVDGKNKLKMSSWNAIEINSKQIDLKWEMNFSLKSANSHRNTFHPCWILNCEWMRAKRWCVDSMRRLFASFVPSHSDISSLVLIRSAFHRIRNPNFSYCCFMFSKCYSSSIYFMCDVCAAKQIDARIETYVSTHVSQNDERNNNSRFKQQQQQKQANITKPNTLTCATHTHTHHQTRWIKLINKHFRLLTCNRFHVSIYRTESLHPCSNHTIVRNMVQPYIRVFGTISPECANHQHMQREIDGGADGNQVQRYHDIYIHSTSIRGVSVTFWLSTLWHG